MFHVIYLRKKGGASFQWVPGRRFIGICSIETTLPPEKKTRNRFITSVMELTDLKILLFLFHLFC